MRWPLPSPAQGAEWRVLVARMAHQIRTPAVPPTTLLCLCGLKVPISGQLRAVKVNGVKLSCIFKLRAGDTLDSAMLVAMFPRGLLCLTSPGKYHPRSAEAMARNRREDSFIIKATVEQMSSQ